MLALSTSPTARSSNCSTIASRSILTDLYDEDEPPHRVLGDLSGDVRSLVIQPARGDEEDLYATEMGFATISSA